MIRSETFSTDIKTLKLGFKDGGCPEGTVPIKRITRDDLIRIKFFTEEYASRLKLNGYQPNNTTHDIHSGNWWLGVGENATLIGFWPKKIFTSLAEHGTFVACGGQVYSPPGQPDPPMGSGFRPKINPRYDAYCKDFIIVNGEHEIEPTMDVEEYSDYDIYKVKDMGIVKGFGHVLLFGGPNKP
ncbi:hypothetical protein Nepgr_004384 [Nepenthes gracilis]|uniref:Neprosin PEP catalytic domain-containing protein n=1 Tax=Nepenthes gracilis TaxID=150966 RepID=A0AAD3S196_NEPGR|nr:hypothetical protein Nepgr_004384 [Nepenthes gracilis]